MHIHISHPETRGDHNAQAAAIAIANIGCSACCPGGSPHTSEERPRPHADIHVTPTEFRLHRLLAIIGGFVAALLALPIASLVVLQEHDVSVHQWAPILAALVTFFVVTVTLSPRHQ